MPNETNLKCDATSQTWTDAPASNEQKPVNCVTWYESFAFCIWDSGCLPTEAEWGYVAAGGDENGLYPWGAAAPSSVRVSATIVNVGSVPTGAGRWTHQDLAGGVYEWMLDEYDAAWYSGAGNRDQ
ncbi:MAG TPA: SUMF1/EgtB/PvdO family nonheme iron enzyme [Polyangiaceae bacterium]